MHILLTNDDGIFAAGLAAMYKQLVKIGDVTVVAPAESRSGTSHSITFAEPLVCNRIDIKGQFTGYSVQGSPADCVKLAFMELAEKPIDLLVSGLNNGANTGINVYYSGTVAAAMEGAFLDIPSVAVSTVSQQQTNFDVPAGYCAEILRQLIPLKSGYVVNVNIPALSNGKPKGLKVVPQSTRGFHERYIRQKDKDGRTVFQLDGGLHRFEEIATDTTSLADGFITITALAPGTTDNRRTRQLQKITWHEDRIIQNSGAENG